MKFTGVFSFLAIVFPIILANPALASPIKASRDGSSDGSGYNSTNSDSSSNNARDNKGSGSLEIRARTTPAERLQKRLRRPDHSLWRVLWRQRRLQLGRIWILDYTLDVL